MQFASQPVNLEGNGGTPLRVSLTLSGVPAGYTLALWAARLADALMPAQLTALGCGAFNLGAQGAVRQDGPLSGLRQAIAVISQTTNGLTTLEGSLFNPLTDMPPRAPNSPSWDVTVNPLLERTDGPWLLAVTACAPDGRTAIVAMGGLGQQAGQEHLAGVWLAPAQVCPEYEVGVWLQNTVRLLKPVLDQRMAQVATGVDLSIKAVEFTEEVLDAVYPAIYILPQRETDAPDGLSAPDRYGLYPTFTLRCVTYGDTPATKVRALTQLAGSLRQLLNTRKLREARLPSGLYINQSRVTGIEYGRTEDTWDSAADVSWQTVMIETGLF